MARRLFAAVVAASALLFISQATAFGQLPDTGSLPGGGVPTTLPKVDLPEGAPKLPPGQPNPGGGTGGPQGGDTPAETPGSKPAPRAPSRHRPAGNAPATKPPGAGTFVPTRRDAQAGRTRPARSGDKQRDASSNPQRRATSTSGAARPAGEHAQLSTAERIFDDVPAGLLTALAVSSLLAAVLSLFWLRERYVIRTERRRALRDPLTGIGNRLAFEQRLAHEWRRARRYGRPLGLLVLDVDGLKRVNDTEGHGAGDALLRSVAEHIATDIRDPDLAARLAGDEFVVLCPETPFAGMQQIAAKLEGRLASSGMRASIGCAEARDGDTRPEDMVARADEAMYREKRSRDGRHAEITAPLGLATAG